MILIPFSSGLDSTALVCRALDKKEEIALCYTTIKNNKTKIKIEIQQREKIISLLKNKYNTCIPTEETIEITVNHNRGIKLPQVPVWIFSLLYSMSSNVNEVRLGYCLYDEAISYIDDIKKIWNSYRPLHGEKFPKLTFPLKKISKKENQTYLADEIFQETFFCENPLIEDESGNEIKWSDCGCCATCKRAKYDGTFYSYKRNAKPTSVLSSLSDGEQPKFIESLTALKCKTETENELRPNEI